MEEPTDIELMLRYKKYRDREAFAGLVRRYQKGLINFFYRLCWDNSLAEDFAQEVFIRVAQNARHYRPAARFNTFLYTIARNMWIDYLRVHKLKTTISLDYSVQENGQKDTKLIELISVKQKPPEENLIKDEMVGKIKMTMRKISEEHQMVINLCIFEQMSYEEAAEILDISVGTVKSRLHFAIIKLKELMKE